MASLKDLRRRIRATKSMQQIFKAMEMVAAAKLRRAQQRAQASSPYARKITEMLASLEFARTMTTELTDRFIKGEIDRIEVMYSHFVNAMTRQIRTEVFLPVGGQNEAAQDRGTIFEPDAETLFAELLPRYATAKLY